uniref:Uncharacterized protein n=1 Tax=Oryza meridionalis TaxID=40149 RepID=A0A0E0C567_9ORYZ
MVTSCHRGRFCYKSVSSSDLMRMPPILKSRLAKNAIEVVSDEDEDVNIDAEIGTDSSSDSDDMDDFLYGIHRKASQI